MSNELQMVGFRIGRETFALPIAAVHEIVRPPEITAVPHAAEYVEGVINLRGRILPVIDLRRRFGATQIENTRKNRILVVNSDGRLIGLMVDAASEVLKLAPGQIEPPPEVFGEAETSYVTGVAKYQGRLIIVVDLKKILQRGDLRRLELTDLPAGSV